jgi:hypothetical protein
MDLKLEVNPHLPPGMFVIKSGEKLYVFPEGKEPYQLDMSIPMVLSPKSLAPTSLDEYLNRRMQEMFHLLGTAQPLPKATP